MIAAGESESSPQEDKVRNPRIAKNAVARRTGLSVKIASKEDFTGWWENSGLLEFQGASGLLDLLFR